jgi:hypothetical protein
MTRTMPRRTIYMPSSVEDLVREHAREGESFSAAIARLVEIGAREGEQASWPDWIGSGEGPGDLGVNAEKYLGLKPWGSEEGHDDQGAG